MNKNKVLLFIGAGPEMVPGIKWAREMGLYVVATDIKPRSVGFKFANKAEIVSTRDIKKTIEVAKKIKSEIGLHGVMTLASDVPLTVSRVADALNLPGLPVNIAEVLQDKLLMKKKLRAYNIPAPQFYSVHSHNEAVDVSKKIGYPLVIKPIDNSGSKGVILVESEADLLNAYSWALKHCLNNRTLLVEEFLKGPQISTESIVYRGNIYTTGFADRNYSLNSFFKPYFIEDGHTIPSSLSDKDQDRIRRLIEKTVRYLNINFGVVKGDVVLTDNGPKIIELAGRLSGGRFCTDTVPIARGINIVKEMIKLSVGESINIDNLKPKFNYAAAQRYLFPKPGKVESIINISKQAQHDWIHKIEIYIKKGNIIEKITNHSQRAGYVITSGKTREEAVKRAEWTRSQIKIYTGI